MYNLSIFIEKTSDFLYNGGNNIVKEDYFMVDAVIELQADTRRKYKIIDGVPKLSEVRFFAMPSPIACGYITHTSIEADKPLEILVIDSEPSAPGCIVPARVVGYLEMYKDGEENFRVISVSDLNPRYNEIQNLADISMFTLNEIKQYYVNYGKLHNHDINIVRYHAREEALELIKKYTVFYGQEESSSN